MIASALTILTPLPEPRPSLRAVVFDFDGTLSTLRHGWEHVMAPLMEEVIAGPTVPTAELRAEVAAYIDHSAGIQTVYQMVWLAETVARYGLNPEVHDAWWYKAEYNRRLMTPVQARIARMQCGQATHEDFLMAGSLAFLARLTAVGLRLFVASGTDHPDVVSEVGALGLTGFFAEVAGAPVGAMDCSKEAVLRKLLQDEGLQGPEVLVIGDGRVEITLGREAGALTLGAATDEEQRHGINPVKAARLTHAGAHALVGDFAALDEICAWAGVR